MRVYKYYLRSEKKMGTDKKDEVVLDTIRQLIKEVKEEMQQKKVLVENKTPQKVFNHHSENLKRYILENVMKALKQSENNDSKRS